MTWPITRLGEICEINPKLPQALLPSDSTPVSFVPMADVNEIHGEIIGGQTRLFGEVKKGYSSFADNDILLAKK